jgi:hypothetical protein
MLYLDHEERIEPQESKMANQIDITKITSAYSGINGKCCCGCAGKHYYTPLGLSQMSETDYRRNVPPNERQVRRIVKKLEELGYTDEGFAFTAVDYSGSQNGRLYLAYKN